MMIQINDDVTHSINGRDYRYIQLCSEKTDLFVTLAPDYVRVLVMNASHRAHRIGGGRQFETIEQAIEAYKTPDVKNILRFLSAEK
jgi:hypothetical protein